MLELVNPFAFLFSLFADGERGIEGQTVFEIGLIGALHLYLELLALFVLAIHVKEGFTLVVSISLMFAVGEGDILDDLLSIEEGVEKVNEQHLVGDVGKDSIETEIGQEADISFCC